MKQSIVLFSLLIICFSVFSQWKISDTAMRRIDSIRIIKFLEKIPKIEYYHEPLKPNEPVMEYPPYIERTNRTYKKARQ